VTRRISPLLAAPLLAGGLLAGPGQGAATAAEVRTPQPGVVCDASGRICRSRSEAAEAGLFRLGPALRCDSQVGLCWQDKPMQTVNWRASRELFGSTSPGSGWGEWRPHGGQLPMQWQSQCQLRQQATLLYEGPCSFREAATISEPPAWASQETAGSPVRTLTIALGDQRTLRFVWDQDRYRLADDGRGPTLSLQDQGSRGVWRWAGMQLFSARSRADLVPPAPAASESTSESTDESTAAAELLEQAASVQSPSVKPPGANTPSVKTAAGGGMLNAPGR
jgi:hypothetical protein